MGTKPCLLFLALATAAAAQWPARLEAWKSEIEQAAPARVLLARVEWDPASNAYSLDPATPGYWLFAAHLQSAFFGSAFRDMYAGLVANPRSGGGYDYLVFLNLGRADLWRAHEEDVLAHELAHAWLHSRGYRAPPQREGVPPCVPVQTGDIVHHVLLRQELARRKIPWFRFWLSQLSASAVTGAGDGGDPADRCMEVRQVAELVDVYVSTEAEYWPERETYLREVRLRRPFAEVEAAQIARWLRGRDLWNQEQYQEALRFVFARLAQAASGGSSPGPSRNP